MAGSRLPTDPPGLHQQRSLVRLAQLDAVPSRAEVSEPHHWWRANAAYVARAGSYRPLDGWLALGFWVFYMALLWIQGSLLASGLPWVGATPHGLTVVGPGVVIELGVIALILRCRRQGLSDLGLHRKNAGRSALWGLGLGAAAIAGAAIVPTVIHGADFYSPSFIAGQAVWFLLWVAVPEEVVFRGFIMSRLTGFMGRVAGPIVAAVLFGLSHLPFQLAISGLSLGDFLAQNYTMLLIPTVWGLLYGFFYAKLDNLLGPIIIHALCDLASMGISPAAF
ncbi:MAG: CPBP family intramembrane metalloprotease [Bifidobacteriaceae bacterium]|jgi:membrane protease YdiL (CAAX protease family)|nr:CPBP family intramembrane metalloprotease [Bifidobacteriaceae bacterium]